MSPLLHCCVLATLLISGGARQLETVKTAPEDLQFRWQNEIPRYHHELPSITLDALDHVKVSKKLRAALASELSWKNCGSAKDPIQLMKLTLPKEVNLEGSFNLSAEVKITRKLTSPIKVTNKVQRYLYFFWLTVPCVEGLLGSCTIADACDLVPLVNGTCPPVFPQNHVPCRCPVPQADYHVLDVPVDLGKLHIPELFASGLYSVRSDITDGGTGQRLGCYTATLRLT